MGYDLIIPFERIPQKVSFAKCHNGTYHGMTKQWLQEYLDEFNFRFNRKLFRELNGKVDFIYKMGNPTVDSSIALKNICF